MKKMMMFVAAMALATFANANAVNWATGTLYVPTAGTGAFGAQVASGAAGYSAIVTFFLDDGGSVGSAIGAVEVTGTTDTTISALRQLNGTTGTYDFTSGSTYWASVYITSNVNGDWYMQSSAASFTISGISAGSVNFTTAGALPSQWTAVPEPTSMALLALGVAAVGLRRRFRK